MGDGKLPERDAEEKRCAWCGELGGARRGSGRSRDRWFHLECHRAVEVCHGWDLEIPAVS